MDVFWRAWLRYGEFDGRSGQGEFWIFHLSVVVILGLIWTIGYLVDPISQTLSDIVVVVGAMFLLFSIVPHFSVTIRRIHDIGKPGAFIFLTFIPVIGFLIFCAFGLEEGDVGENGYGFDPREPNSEIY